MWVRVRRYRSAPLTDPPQQIQDVKGKLEDLIPWVAKLEDTLMKADVEDHGEAERRTQLGRFESHICYLAPLN